jgi:ABC-type transport system involved in cytochrome c biogenesis permease subunit
MTEPIQATTAPTARRLALIPMGLSLSLLVAISYVLCIALGLVRWDAGLHQPWLQFLPGFTWLSWGSFFLGLVESFACGWYVALVFHAPVQPLQRAVRLRGGCDVTRS